MYVWLVIVMVVMEMVVKGCDGGADICAVGDSGGNDGSDGDGNEGVW